MCNCQGALKVDEKNKVAWDLAILGYSQYAKIREVKGTEKYFAAMCRKAVVGIGKFRLKNPDHDSVPTN